MAVYQEIRMYRKPNDPGPCGRSRRMIDYTTVLHSDEARPRTTSCIACIWRAAILEVSVSTVDNETIAPAERLLASTSYQWPLFPAPVSVTRCVQLFPDCNLHICLSGLRFRFPYSLLNNVTSWMLLTII